MNGDTEVATWSIANIAGIPMDKYCDECNGARKLSKRQYMKMLKMHYHIIREGATYYAVPAVKESSSYRRDENSILTVSSLLEGQWY